LLVPTERTGTDGCTLSIIGVVQKSEIGSKSFVAS